jgi:hypothetical protein
MNLFSDLAQFALMVFSYYKNEAWEPRYFYLGPTKEIAYGQWPANTNGEDSSQG